MQIVRNLRQHVDCRVAYRTKIHANLFCLNYVALRQNLFSIVLLAPLRSMHTALWRHADQFRATIAAFRPSGGCLISPMAYHHFTSQRHAVD